MKCLAVFSTLPDLLYLWTDKHFENHLVEAAITNRITEDVIGHNEESIQNFASHFFSPLVTSNKYMKEVNNPYRMMICENGFIFAMNQLANLYFVAVCGDGEESELFLQRKINFFNYLLLLHYGPCAVEHLKPQFPILRKKTWNYLKELLLTWQTLCQQEQMFLVEALERLHVNQQLNSVSLNLLGEVLVRTNRDGHTVHALLLVNNKLLGLYSNERSPELQVSDILMLTVLIKNKFKYNDDTVPKSIYRTPQPLCDKTTQLKDDKTLFQFCSRKSKPVDISKDEDEDVDLDYHSAFSTPEPADSFHTPRPSMVFTSGNIEYRDDVLDFDLSMNEADLELVTSSPEEEYNLPIPSEMKSETEYEQDSVNDDSKKKDESTKKDKKRRESKKDDEEVLEYFQQCVFLRAGECGYSPHTIHCLLLDNATVLIIISQNRHMNLAFVIQNLLRWLTNILALTRHKLPSYRNRLLDDSEKAINKIQTFFSKHVEIQTERLSQCCKLFDQAWTLVQNAGLSDFINSDVVAVDMPQRLETTLNELVKRTKSLFSCLFISVSQRRLARYEKQLKVILNVRDMALRKLSHFSDYLQVRGQRNVTMTAYHNDFPGLVHFVYINRNIDQLIAPTINVNKDSNTSHKLPIYIVIKQRIWDLWQYTETMLTNGYTGLMVRDGDFIFSYFLWFEDMLGRPLVTLRSLKGLNETKPTGILSGSYYRDIIRHLFPAEPTGTVHCYELLTMHIGAVSNHFVATSCRKLTRLLWETSGEANSPVNLL